ncbi:MAG: TusE/DsrC/DsvC family sulfur relay protein [Gammaproteobacteria bacterium]|nr:TusE/DsrC/DsvC family sulfur relay protein [Gammaproteobacteria bacterium]
MQTDPYIASDNYVMVNGEKVALNVEGYIQDLDDWSEDFVVAMAEKEELELTDEHWQVIQYLREYHDEHQVQCPVRDMIKHFSKEWGELHGNNHYLHDLFPKGGPQKQGNRLAGIRKTKGEH